MSHTVRTSIDVHFNPEGVEFHPLPNRVAVIGFRDDGWQHAAVFISSIEEWTALADALASAHGFLTAQESAKEPRAA